MVTTTTEAQGNNGNGNGNGNGQQAARLRIVELHEVRSINALLKDLTELGFTIDALIPQERTGEEGSRYTLRRGETETAVVPGGNV